jgi:hypothetical protein
VDRVHTVGPAEHAFLAAHTRVFLLATRADGSPTGWPMVGIHRDDALEFSTYRRSQKVRDLLRDPAAACVVAPTDGDRALSVRGTAAVVEADPDAAGGGAPTDGRVDPAVAARARARMASGQRVVVRVVPTDATWVPGWTAG